jgi:prevent-host-death family protein
MEAIMGTVGSYEAKTHLSKLLKRTAKGEQITITKHGVSVAMLVPAKASREADVRTSIEKIREFRKGHALGGIKLREMIEEGRRF